MNYPLIRQFMFCSNIGLANSTAAAIITNILLTKNLKISNSIKGEEFILYIISVILDARDDINLRHSNCIRSSNDNYNRTHV